MEHTKTIGGRSYTFTTPSSFQSRTLYPKIQNILVCFGDDELADGTTESAIVFASLINALKEGDLETMVKAFGPQTKISGQDPVSGQAKDMSLGDAIVQDTLFRDNIDHMFEWLDWCLECTYGGVIKKHREGNARNKLTRALRHQKLSETQ
jgi:hypothetical protein